MENLELLFTNDQGETLTLLEITLFKFIKNLTFCYLPKKNKNKIWEDITISNPEGLKLKITPGINKVTILNLRLNVELKNPNLKLVWWDKNNLIFPLENLKSINWIEKSSKRIEIL